MHAKRRLLTAGLAGALVAGLLPAAAGAAEIVPGRPGRYELSSITIDATSGDCRATYETPAAGNLWMRGVDATVRVVTNPVWVHVTCRFADMSRLIEADAEVGYTDACTLVTETATYTDGWGSATSAANIGERADGGISMARCRFRLEPTQAAPGPTAAAASRATEPTEKGKSRRNGATAGPRRSSSARDTETSRRGPAKPMKPATKPHEVTAKTHKVSKKGQVAKVKTPQGRGTRDTQRGKQR